MTHSLSHEAGAVRIAGTVGRGAPAVERAAASLQRIPAAGTGPAACAMPGSAHACGVTQAPHQHRRRLPGRAAA